MTIGIRSRGRLFATWLLASSFGAASVAFAASAPAPQDPGPVAPEGFRFERLEDAIKIEPGVRIEVLNLFGDVRARYGGRDDVLGLLSIAQQFADEGPEVEVVHRQDGDTLRIEVGVREREGAALHTVPEPGQRKRADLVLFVPDGRALGVRTGDGLVQLRGLRSDATARSASGDMQVRSIRGSLDLASDSGDLVVILESLGLDAEQRFAVGSGELQLHLREDGDYAVEARARGRIRTEYSLEVGPTGRDGARTARAVLGDGTTPVRIDAGVGLLRLLRKPSAEVARMAPEDDA